jgi:ABC-type glycerol-3-phosphate transport system substrate-binding protein
MKFIYEIDISADLGNMLSPIGDMMENVNSHLATVGFNEKLSLRSKISTMTLTIEHELNDNEKDKVKETIISQFNSAHPAWKVKVESFRRQSGNVQQSVA